MTKGLKSDEQVWVSRRGHDLAGDSYIEVSAKYSKGKPRKRWFSLSELANSHDPLFAFFGAAGGGPFSSADRRRNVERVERLAHAKDVPTATVFTQPGWARVGNQDIYVAPWERIYGPEGFEGGTCFSANFDTGKWGKAGSFEDWLALLKSVPGENVIPVFCVMLAFAGPILAPLNRPNAAFMLVGPTSGGKSTSAQVAGAAVGGAPASELGYSLTWLQTANNFDQIMRRYADNFLVIDDTAQGEGQGKVVGEVLFRITTGSAKGRYNDPAPPREARFAFLTSSNEFLPDLLGRHGQWIDQSQFVRLVEIPAQRRHGVFDVLPKKGMESHVFADMIRAGASKTFGIAVRRFLRRLTEELAVDREGLIAWLKDRMERFRPRLPVDDGDSAQARIREHFVTVYAAGRLALRYDLLPWSSKHLSEAVIACHAANRQCLTARAVKVDLIARLIAYIRANLDSFVDVRTKPAAPEIASVAPRFITSSEGRKEYAFRYAAFANIFGDKRMVKEAVRRLSERGFLVRDKDRPQVKRRLEKGRDPERVYAVSASILARGRHATTGRAMTVGP
jgi:hypothetical protein